MNAVIGMNEFYGSFLIIQDHWEVSNRRLHDRYSLRRNYGLLSPGYAPG